MSSNNLLLDHSNQVLHHLNHLWWLALVMPRLSIPILLIPTIARVVWSVPSVLLRGGILTFVHYAYDRLTCYRISNLLKK